jgi:phosphoglycerate dehydrogenase-like enzyme
MRVAVLDDYQHAFERSAAIDRLRRKAEVEIYTEKLSNEALISILKGVQTIIPIRERTRFPAELLRALPDLELVAQTGNHAYHVDVDAATRAGILITMAPGGNSTTELTFGLMIAVMRRIPRSDAEGFAETATENILGYMEGTLVRALNPEALEERKKRS